MTLNTLGDLLVEVRTWNPSKEGNGRAIQYIDLSAVDNERKEIASVQSVRASDAPSRARQLVQGGDILVSSVRPYLNGVARVPPSLNGATASTGFCVLRPNPERLSAEYLFHWVRMPQFVSDMTKKATGASYPAVSDRIIFESKLPLPSLSEQRRIAAILDQADELRRKREKSPQRMLMLRESMVVNMFGDPTQSNSKWPRSRLGDLCDVRDGTHDSPKYTSVGKYLLTSKNFSDGRLDYKGAQFISEADYDAINRRSKVDCGDIIMPMIGTIGSPVLLQDQPDFAIKNVALFKMGRASIRARYLLALLSGPYLEFVQSQRERGGSQKFLSLGDLRSLLVPVPPVGMQIAFERFDCQMDEVRSAMATDSARLNQLFQTLQSQFFSQAPDTITDRQTLAAE